MSLSIIIPHHHNLLKLVKCLKSVSSQEFLPIVETLVIIDKNNFQQTGSNSEIMDLGELKKKWLSFKWEVNEIDGHNLSELLNYFENLKENKIPKVLIANTTKGKGFTFSENKNEWHHSVMTKNIYEKALKEIK